MALVLGTNCGFVTSAPSADPGGSNYDIYKQCHALKVTASENGTVTEIGIYVDNATDAANMDLGIYDHNSGDNNPEVKLSGATIAKGTTSGWKTISVVCPITAGTVYWIAGQCDATATRTNTNNATDATQKRDTLNDITFLPNPWGISYSTGGQLLAVYALYTPSGGGTSSGAIRINVGDAWKNISGAKINIGDAWKNISGAKINIGDAWKTLF